MYSCFFKRIFCFFFFLVCIKSLKAQDVFALYKNNKVVAKNNGQNTSMDTLPIDISGSKSKWTISFKDVNPTTIWKRSILIYTSNDSLVHTHNWKKNGGKMVIPKTVMQFFSESKMPMCIYTISKPKSPSMKAAVRIRRVPLITLIWK